MRAPNVPEGGGTPEPHARIMALLRSLEVREIFYALSGGGDDGEIMLEEVTYSSGATSKELPAIPIGLDSRGAICSLSPTLERIAADLPEGDWVNNEGGAGTVTIRPFEVEPALRFDCDMTYGDEDYDEEQDFEDIEIELEAALADEPVPAIRLIADMGDAR